MQRTGVGRFLRRSSELLVITTLVAGCAAAPRRPAPASEARAPLRVVVENGTSFEMSLFAHPEAGGRFRIGTIGANETRMFIVRHGMLGAGSFRIVGDPVGSVALRASEPMHMMGGMTAYWRIGVSAASSSTMVR